MHPAWSVIFFTVLAGTYLGLAISHADSSGHEIHTDHQPEPSHKVEPTGTADV